MAAAAVLKNKKSPYLGYNLTDFYKIWHGDAMPTLLICPIARNLKFLKSKTAAAAMLKNQKSPLCRLRFDRFQRNLARWCSLALLSFPIVKFPEFENPRWRRPQSWKIEKSPYLSRSLSDFNEMWHSDTIRPS